MQKEKIFSFLGSHQKLIALFLYITIISFIYAPVVFLGRSLQPPLLYKNIVTEEGVYGYQSRKPVNSLNVDLTNGVYNNWPTNKLIGDIYKKGQVPLWNPYQAGGIPLPEQPGTRVFSPYQILENIAPIWTWDFFMLGRLLIAGFFTFLFLRLLKISWLSAFLGGLLFMFSGSFTVFMQNEQMVNVTMMIPVLLWALERLFSRPNGRNIVLSAFIFAILLTSGTSGVILYTLLLGGVYFAFRVITLKIPGFSLRSLIFAKIKSFSLIIFAFILGLGLASPFIFPFLEFFSHTTNLRAFHGLLAAPRDLIGLAISPGMAEIPTFYRISPVNGLFDFLGGYTGILSVYLIILGCLITIIFLRKKIFHSHFLFFYFFLGFGLFIILKNFGVSSFNWIGYLPFFNIVWSPRWAGPIWIFCLSIAGTLGFELLKEEKIRILEEIQQSKALRFFIISALILASCVLLALPFYFYNQSDHRLGFDSIAQTIPLVRWELFIISLFTSVLILGLVVYLTRSFLKNQNKGALYGLFGLALLELWFWVPRGYDLNSMRFKFGLFIFGLAIVILILKRKWPLVLIGSFLFFLFYIFLDIAAPYGLPQRYNSFTEPPYIKFLKNQSEHWRVMGDTSALMPNWASAFGIMDVRFIVESGTSFWQEYFRKNSLQGSLRYSGVLCHWFVGAKSEEQPQPTIEHIAIKKDLCPGMTIAEFFNRSKYDHVEDRIRLQLPFYSLLGVKYILTNDPDINKDIEKDSSFYFPQIYQGEVNIFENRSVLPRVFIVHDVEYASSFREAQKMLKEKDFDLRRKIVLEEKLPSENYLGPGEENFASITDYGYNKVAIKAEAKTPGILVLSDVFYPGWKAEIDGNPAKIYRVDGLLRGVYLPSGIHEVVFSYWPPSFAKGLAVALLSFLACLVLIIFFRPEQISKKILASIIIFLLITPCLYFYFQSFQNFISLSKFKSESELKEKEEKLIAEEKEKSREEEYGESRQDEESRQAAISFIYENIEDFTAFKDSLNKKWVPTQFWFPKDSSTEVYVQLENGQQKRKILIYVKEIENIFHNAYISPFFKYPQFIRGAALIQRLESMFSIPQVLHVNFFFFSYEKGKIDAKISMVVGYFDEVNGDWILEEGNDLLSGEDLTSYKYDCNKFDWVRQFNIVKL